MKSDDTMNHPDTNGPTHTSQIGVGDVVMLDDYGDDVTIYVYELEDEDEGWVVHVDGFCMATGQQVCKRLFRKEEYGDVGEFMMVRKARTDADIVVNRLMVPFHNDQRDIKW